MGDYERVLAAYLYLIALGASGLEAQFDYHWAWINYCRNINRSMHEDQILGAAITQGFQL